MTDGGWGEPYSRHVWTYATHFNSGIGQTRLHCSAGAAGFRCVLEPVAEFAFQSLLKKGKVSGARESRRPHACLVA